MRGEKQMNRKEKKAVGLLKALNNLEKKCKIEKVPYKSEIKKIMISLLPEDYGIFEILLNLIEKLQKENEELKSNNEKYIIHLTDEQYKTVIENAQNDINQKWIQKVKDKIEEIDKIYNDIPEDEGKFAKAILIKEKQVLQELLEGRK